MPRINLFSNGIGQPSVNKKIMDKVFIIIQAITGGFNHSHIAWECIYFISLKPLHYPFKPTNDRDKEDRIYNMTCSITLIILIVSILVFIIVRALRLYYGFIDSFI